MSTFNWTVTEPTTDKVFDQLQEELKIWQAHNFPGRESWCPLLGIIEEVGELCEAETEEEYIDAIGDCCVYIADFCNAMNYNMAKIYDIIPYENLGESNNFSIACGKLSHAYLKLAQKIRLTELHEQNIQLMLKHIMINIRVHTDKSLEEITWQVWLKVRERDWQANRNEAHKI